MRNRYGQFLPLKYYKEDIHVQSTDVDRTLMSAYSVLAGLYEPDLKDNWNPDIKWQPIPVHTTPEKLDEVNKTYNNFKFYMHLLLMIFSGFSYEETLSEIY